MARVILSSEKFDQIHIIPIAGRGHDLAQPFVLRGERAHALLEDIKKRTAALDTKMEVNEGIRLIVTNAHGS